MLPLHTAEILLPRAGVDLSKWAVISCDQHTAEPDYWRAVETAVGDSPSTLKLTLPEIYLNETETRVPRINAEMRRVLDEGILLPAVQDGMICIERETVSGIRPGLIAALDLDQYDYSKDSVSPIRATEATVAERLPARMRIREGASIELPHVMMLIDDPGCTVIEPLAQAATRPLYDFDLMLGSGHLKGAAVEGDALKPVFEALEALSEKSGGLLFAVGDGNHSLAAAKGCWEKIKAGLSEEERARHPARFALAEIVNVHCPALRFEPIHRVLTNVDPDDVISEWRKICPDGGGDLIVFTEGREWRFGSEAHPLRALQPFLDAYLKAHPGAGIDYIHDEASLRALVKDGRTMGFMPRAFEKSELFDYVRSFGSLPRKTFSMGESKEKRFYLEARKII